MQLYVELWNAKQPWLDLSPEERQTYFDMVGEEIGKLTDAGIDLVGFAINGENTSNRSNHRYLAVWKMPTTDHVKMLEDSVSQAGWYKYFDQVNAGGELIPPPAALDDMINMK